MPAKHTTQTFIIKAQLRYGEERYGYGDVIYVHGHTKVTIHCNVCDRPFEQAPYSHLAGHGCPRCGWNQRDKPIEKPAPRSKLRTTEIFVAKAREVRGDSFDYSMCNYVNSQTKVCIKCNTCQHVFWQRPDNHLNRKSGCKKCRIALIKGILTHDIGDFVERAIIVHGSRDYDYSHVEYKGSKHKVKIFCNSCQKFFSQTPHDHLAGCGCPACTQSTGERKIAKTLDNLGIQYQTQKSFPGCSHKRPLKFDFYVPMHKTCIEYQGKQHHEPIGFFGGTAKLEANMFRDQIKRDWCAANGIRLIEIPYTCQDITTFLCEQLGLLQMPLFLR